MLISDSEIYQIIDTHGQKQEDGDSFIKYEDLVVHLSKLLLEEKKHAFSALINN